MMIHPLVKFYVKDYTTELVGRYDQEGKMFYIQKGDGNIIAKYEEYRIIKYSYLEVKTNILKSEGVIKNDEIKLNGNKSNWKCKLGFHKYKINKCYGLSGIIYKCERCEKLKNTYDSYC